MTVVQMMPYGATTLSLADVSAPAPYAAGAVWNLYPGTYTGPCLTICPSNATSTTTDIYFDANGLVDLTAIVAACGSNDGWVVRVYDQLTGTQLFGRSSVSTACKIYDGATQTLVTSSDGVPGFEKDVNQLFTQLGSQTSEYGAMCRVSTTDTNFTMIGNSGKNNNYIGIGTSGSTSTVLCNNDGSFSLGRHYKNGVLQSIANRGDMYTTFATGADIRYVGIAPLNPGNSSGNYMTIGEYPGNSAGLRMTPCFQSGYWLIYTSSITDTHVANIDSYLVSAMAAI